MMWRPLLVEYTADPLRLAGRIIVPLVAVAVGGLLGYAGLVLIALLIFVVVTGTAINLVKLRLSGMFRRVVVSERPKKEIFSAYTANFVLIYSAQFFPAMLAGAWFGGLVTHTLCGALSHPGGDQRYIRRTGLQKSGKRAPVCHTGDRPPDPPRDHHKSGKSPGSNGLCDRGCGIDMGGGHTPARRGNILPGVVELCLAIISPIWRMKPFALKCPASYPGISPPGAC